MDVLQKSDIHSDYLTSYEICQQGGLTIEQFVRLDSARLLVPDLRDGRFRPKLVSWAKKLAYLMNSGWRVSEIKLWARGRWHTEDTLKWPPDRDFWK